MAVQPKVSILIPFYNCPYVDQAIISALGQTYPNVEVIVISDGSTVHTERVEPFHSRIRYVEKRNGGTGSALNTGLWAAQGDYIAWLSSDDLFYPNKIAAQLQFMLRSGAEASFTNWHVINTCSEITHENAGIVHGDELSFYRSFLTGNLINGCTVMMGRRLMLEIGPFNENLETTQDYDYWMRVMTAGHDFHFLNLPLTMYRVHEAMGTLSKAEKVSREMAKVQMKYASALISALEDRRQRRGGGVL